METAQHISSLNQPVKLASLVWYHILPAKYGGQKVIAAFQEALSKHLPMVSICSKDNKVDGKEVYEVLPILPISKWQVINPMVWIKVAKLVKQQGITHLIIEHPYHVLTAWWCKIFRKVTIIHHAHNIEFERFELRGKWFWPLIRFAEQKMSQLARLNIYLTQEDKTKAKAYFKLKEEQCFVLPYSIERRVVADKKLAKAAIITRHQILPTEKILLFNGTLDYQPNAKAVEDIFDRLLPEMQDWTVPFRILITGKINKSKYEYLEKFMNQKVMYLGDVDDVATYFAAADVYINPVTKGAGVQTKTLEAIAYGLSVVCFGNMLNGIDTTVTKGLLFVAQSNNWKDFSENIQQALVSEAQVPDSFWQYYDINYYMIALTEKICKR
jgi:hypothetical protein